MVMVLLITPFVGGDPWRLEKKRGQTGFERVGRTLAARAFSRKAGVCLHGFRLPSDAQRVGSQRPRTTSLKRPAAKQKQGSLKTGY